MKHNYKHYNRLSATIAALTLSSVAHGQATINIDATKQGVTVPKSLYGIFFEDINHAGDGGIYPELVQNRDFESTDVPEGTTVEGNRIRTPKGHTERFQFPSPVPGWHVLNEGGPDMRLSLDTEKPLYPNNPHSLRVVVGSVTGKAGVFNEGFWGMGIRQNEKVKLLLNVRSNANYDGTITASVESENGAKIYAKQMFKGVGMNWKTFRATLAPNATDAKARLAISFSKPGTFWLDQVSLFPQKTFKNRPNGLRDDLASLVADMKPAFIRFPGGCYQEGFTLANRWQWKTTLGNPLQRKGRWDLWGYHATEALGYHEYLQMCEDTGAVPLYVTHSGISCIYRSPEFTPLNEMDWYVQDMLDAIEYANGPVSSKWGAVRAKNGHPKPFGLKYIEIGNEDYIKEYEDYYKIFYDVLKAKHPEIITIAASGVKNTPMEVIDEHYYVAPDFFFANAHKYDNYDRKGPKVYVGEYAVNNNVGHGNLIGALSEAAFMIGMERNSDVVQLASYAPLFVNVHDRAWPVNLIEYDSGRSYGRTSYYVQKLFGVHRPDTTIPTTVEDTRPRPAPSGGIGLGTWNTVAEYKDITVTQGGQAVYTSNFSDGKAENWNANGGTWEVSDGVYRQTDVNATNFMSAFGKSDWHDYTLRLKARKISGKEGFLVMVRDNGRGGFIQWNVGGWGNTRTAIQHVGSKAGGQDVVVERPDSIEANRWYDLRIELKGEHVACYLDDKLVQEADISTNTLPALFVTSGRDARTGQIIIKIVNAGETAQTTTLNINGVRNLMPQGQAIVMSGDKPTDENSFDDPQKIAPFAGTVSNVGPHFTYTFKPYSLTVLRLSTK